MNLEIETPKNRLTDCNEYLFDQKIIMMICYRKSRVEPDSRTEE